MHYRHNWHVVKHLFKYFLLQMDGCGVENYRNLAGTVIHYRHNWHIVKNLFKYFLLQMGSCGAESYR